MTKKHPTSIYRQAALDAQFMHQYGEARMIPRAAHTLFFVSLALLVLLGFAFIYFQPIFDTAAVKGWVSTTNAGVEVRSQESAGVVKQVFVSNGATILAGEPIATISRSPGVLLGKVATERKYNNIKKASAARRAILERNKANLVLEATNLKAKDFQIREQISSHLTYQKTHKAQLNKSQERLTSLDNLLAKGMINQQRLEQSELQILNLHQQEFELYIQLKSLQSNLADLSEQIKRNQQLQAKTQHEIDLSNIQDEQALDNFQNETDFTVFAPKEGVIDNLQIDAGKSVLFNQVIAHISPHHPQFTIKLALPSHQVAFVQNNQSVLLTVDGFPHQKYGSISGHIAHISKQVISPSDYTSPLVLPNQPVYLIDIDFEYEQEDEAAIALRSGMTVSASIVKQELTILEWLLAPLFEALSPSLENGSQR